MTEKGSTKSRSQSDHAKGSDEISKDARRQIKMGLQIEIKEKDKSYMIRPRSVFISPLDQYTSDIFKEKWKKNRQITNHCNYGFNYDTINSYALLLKRLLQAYDICGSQRIYKSNNIGLLRLNDEIPMDFGGFGPVINKKVLEVSSTDDFSSGDSLFEYFIELCCNQGNRDRYPLVKFVGKVNEVESSDELGVITNTIVSRIDQQFRQSMQIIRKRNEQLGIKQEQKETGSDLDSDKDSNDINFYSHLFSGLHSSPNKQRIQLSSASSSSKSNIHPAFQSNGKRIKKESQTSREELSKALIKENGAVVFKKCKDKTVISDKMFSTKVKKQDSQDDVQKPQIKKQKNRSDDLKPHIKKQESRDQDLMPRTKKEEKEDDDSNSQKKKQKSRDDQKSHKKKSHKKRKISKHKHEKNKKHKGGKKSSKHHRHK